MTINEASAQTPAAAPPTVPAFAGNHQIKPLKFDPAKLEGLSERLITSHHENNYAGSVKTLNALRPRLAAALADTEAPPAIYGGLKREELHRTGSVVLHEIYFDGLGGDGRAAGSGRAAIDAAFGSFAAFEAHCEAEITAGRLDPRDFPVVIMCLRRWEDDGTWAAWQRDRIWERGACAR